MARRALKVFRTPIGFHDAYVAAPSQKAALEAWGSDANLFARGAAELVTDETLTREPLARPGEVIRVRRGTEAEHFAALGRSDPTRKTRRKSGTPTPSRNAVESKPLRTAPAVSKPAAKLKSKPRPSRAALDRAEAALDAATIARDDVRATFAERERSLKEERRKAEAAVEARIASLRKKAEAAKGAYQAKIEAWTSR